MCRVLKQDSIMESDLVPPVDGRSTFRRHLLCKWKAEGASPAKVAEMNTRQGEPPCKDPEAEMSLPCLEIRGGLLLLEHWDQGREGSARCADKPGSRRLGSGSMTCHLAGEPLWAGCFPAKRHVAHRPLSLRTGQRSTLGRHLGLWTRSFEAQTHFCTS